MIYSQLPTNIKTQVIAGFTNSSVSVGAYGGYGWVESTKLMHEDVSWGPFLPRICWLVWQSKTRPLYSKTIKSFLTVDIGPFFAWCMWRWALGIPMHIRIIFEYDHHTTTCAAIRHDNLMTMFVIVVRRIFAVVTIRICIQFICSIGVLSAHNISTTPRWWGHTD